MTEDSILDNINSPSDLKKLGLDELNKLSDEIREEIIYAVSQNGGHLASNLGVVELTVEIHSVFNTPEDKIVWDVGHQSYAHKILTGRREQLKTIRTEGGLSGFPKRNESEYDCFDTGHSSTSVSAAFGIACAGSINNEKNYTIAVIGDGALSGGLALEALNSVGKSKENLIVILNDNKMSISKNVGSMAKHLTRLRIRPSYLDAKINPNTIDCLVKYLHNRIDQERTKKDDGIKAFTAQSKYHDLSQVGLWCLTRRVHRTLFADFVGVDAEFDFYYQFQSFDFNRFEISWVIRWNDPALKAIAKNKRVKSAIREIIIKKLQNNVLIQRDVERLQAIMQQYFI